MTEENLNNNENLQNQTKEGGKIRKTTRKP